VALRSPLPICGSDIRVIPEADSARLKARQLLCEMLPPAQRQELLATDSFHQRGKLATYRICSGSQTELYRDGRLVAHGCLQLTVPSPSYDRMIAEYLILNSDEGLYWEKANILPITSRRVGVSLILLIVFNIGLLLNLVTNYLF
jgi:hypothetical protein